MNTQVKRPAKPSAFVESIKRVEKLFNPHYYATNLTFFVFILAYVIIQVALVAYQATTYYNLYKDKDQRSAIAVTIAKSCGILINFHMMLILVVILKRCLTRIRKFKVVNKILPIDEFLMIHKFSGVLVVILSLVHTSAHVYNLTLEHDKYVRGEYRNETNRTYTLEELMFTDKYKTKWLFNIACPTGWVVLIFMIFINLLALPCVRQRFFELFLYSHRLHAVNYILLLFHCQNFWKWFIAPFVLVILEITISLYTTESLDHGLTYIKDIILLPSNVIQLRIIKPKKFKFKAGDYMKIKIPVISKIEYHPFTISSAPENASELWLHIRGNGDWTNELVSYFSYLAGKIVQREITTRNSLSEEVAGISNSVTTRSIIRVTDEIELKTAESRFSNSSDAAADEVVLQECKIDNFVSKTHRLSIREVKSKKKKELPKQVGRKVMYKLIESKELNNVFLDVVIDGPFGTAARNTFKTKHAILVGSGIGVTPYASILQSVWIRHSMATRSCPNCNHTAIHSVGVDDLKKIDFMWINREYESFEWFMDLIAELENQQTISDERFIDFHLFATTKDFLNSNVMKQFHETARKIENENVRKKISDLLGSIRNRRPVFVDVLKGIVEKSKYEVDQIEVFFCGNKQTGESLKDACLQLKLKFSQENF